MLPKQYLGLDKSWELKSSHPSWQGFAHLQCLDFSLDHSPPVQTTLPSSAGSFPAQSFHEAPHIPLLPAQTLFM